jgi:hypothetical protein
MLVVRIELWPHGDESRRKIMATGTIINDGSGSSTCGNYLVSFRRVSTAGRLSQPVTGCVSGFPRKRSGPWELLALALQNALGHRLKKLPKRCQSQ